MYLLNGLNGKYDNIINVIMHRQPFPTFEEARSMLILEEDRLGKRKKTTATNNESSSSTKVLAVTASTPEHRSSSHGDQQQQQFSNKGRGRNRGRRRHNNNSHRSQWRIFEHGRLFSAVIAQEIYIHFILLRIKRRNNHLFFLLLLQMCGIIDWLTPAIRL